MGRGNWEEGREGNIVGMSCLRRIHFKRCILIFLCMWCYVHIPVWLEEEVGFSEAVVTGGWWVLGIKYVSSSRAISALNS